MKIRKFKAENFRNIEKCELDFSDGVNLLYGNNAQGKTNAIEGIYMFSRGRSFRLSEDKELVRFGADGFRIYLEYESKDGIGTLEYASFGREKLKKKNGYKVSKMADFISSFKSVLFFPDNLELVKDGPEMRRAFLNVALSQCSAVYIANYSRYKQSLENRNALLKSASKGLYVDRGELESWSAVMAESASYIYKERMEYIERLSPHVMRIASELSEDKERVELIFKSDIDEPARDIEQIKEKYTEIFTRNLEKEMMAGTSLYGPHRDDILINVNGISARVYASQGQQRSIVLAIKLAEGEVIREIFGEEPVYLFDDVLSELDEKRRRYVICGMQDRQIVITSCQGDDFSFADKVIRVEGGEYVSSHR